MTISSTYSPVNYTGNGVTTLFAFPYVFYDNTDLAVYLDGVIQSSGYTVSGGGGEDGSVTFTNAPTSGVIVTIEIAIPFTQTDDYVENQAFPANTLERGLDKAAIRDQQLSARIDRALAYPAGITGITSTDLPAPVDGEALVFDGTTGAMTTSGSYITDAVAAATAAVTGTSLITATSTTSLTVTGTGEKIWTIGSGKGFALGQRLRASSDDGTKINEGLVTDYTGTSLTINVDYVSGSGTHADWNIGVIGSRGAAGAGTGDVLAANAGYEYTSVASTFRSNIGLDTGATSSIETIRSIPQNTQSNEYTLVASDAGKHILHPSADTTARIFTIPSNSSVSFPIGTAITIVNQDSAGVLTINITTDTLVLAGNGATGSRTLAANGIATILKITSTIWMISGIGLT